MNLIPSVLQLDRARVRSLAWQSLEGAIRENSLDLEKKSRREGFGEKQEDLERRAGLPDLSMAADHNAAGRERPMLGPDVGDLTHL